MDDVIDPEDCEGYFWYPVTISSVCSACGSPLDAHNMTVILKGEK